MIGSKQKQEPKKRDTAFAIKDSSTCHAADRKPTGVAYMRRIIYQENCDARVQPGTKASDITLVGRDCQGAIVYEGRARSTPLGCSRRHGVFVPWFDKFKVLQQERRLGGVCALSSGVPRCSISVHRHVLNELLIPGDCPYQLPFVFGCNSPRSVRQEFLLAVSFSNSLKHHTIFLDGT